MKAALFLPKNKLLKNPVSILSIGSVSASGSGFEEIWNKYKNPEHFIVRRDFNGKKSFAAFLPETLKHEVEKLRGSALRKNVDDSVLYAILAARKAVRLAGWEKGGEIGINIGSSRGATKLFEQYHKDFIQTGKAETLASPSTTLGNISSWVAQDLQSTGPEISHSVTCSTGLHAVLNGIAWLKAGMAKKFLVGGSEAALTPFTIAQMQAMKIYAQKEQEYPCQALNMEKKRNTMVLGEGAAVLCLEDGAKEEALALISGIGYAAEKVKHSVSISANGEGFQKAMAMALGDLPPSEVDAVVMHAPGTVKGDLAEVNAIKAFFGNDFPALTTNKWKLGHTFGASGVLSLELAIMMLHHQEFISVPFSEFRKEPQRLKNILVNAIGFGGNVVSVLLTK